MRSELYMKTLQLEGELFKLDLKLDKETNHNRYCAIKKEMELKRTQVEQYRMIIDEIEKQKTIKRKMLR